MGKQPCLHCGREFVRLGAHKCSRAPSSPSGASTAATKVKIAAQSAAETPPPADQAVSRPSPSGRNKAISSTKEKTPTKSSAAEWNPSDHAVVVSENSSGNLEVYSTRQTKPAKCDAVGLTPSDESASRVDASGKTADPGTNKKAPVNGSAVGLCASGNRERALGKNPDPGTKEIQSTQSSAAGSELVHNANSRRNVSGRSDPNSSRKDTTPAKSSNCRSISSDGKASRENASGNTPDPSTKTENVVKCPVVGSKLLDDTARCENASTKTADSTTKKTSAQSTTVGPSASVGAASRENASERTAEVSASKKGRVKCQAVATIPLQETESGENASGKTADSSRKEKKRAKGKTAGLTPTDQAVRAETTADCNTEETNCAQFQAKGMTLSDETVPCESLLGNTTSSNTCVLSDYRAAHNPSTGETMEAPPRNSRPNSTYAHKYSEPVKLETCQTCDKSFKRLCQHKCRGISSPSTPLPLDPSLERPGSSSSSGRKPVIDVVALEDMAREVMGDLNLEACHDPTGQAIAFFESEVKMDKKNKDNTLKAFEPFRKRIKQHLDDSQNDFNQQANDPTKCLKWDALNSGSSYDGTKVARADEVDCMFFPHLPSNLLTITRDGAPPGFCFVTMTSPVTPKDPGGQFLLSFSNEQGYLSSQLFHQKVFEVLKRAVVNERRATVDPDGKPGAAALPVLLNAFPRKEGEKGQGHEPISIDLVPALKLEGFPPGCDHNLRHVPDKEAEAIRRNGYHVIPKECPHGEYKDVSHLLWRLSFSLAEKGLTKYADRRVTMAPEEGQDPKKSPPTIRKRVLRMLKRLLEIFKGMDYCRKSSPKMKQFKESVDYLKKHKGYGDLKIEKFSTYQIRTLLWTEFYVTRPGSQFWGKESFRTRFIGSLDKMLRMLSGRMLVTHFLLSELDIMAEVPIREREYLYILFFIARELF